ncbi:MAG TPA: 4'-phosphopantetheinyl transferase superfamily protein, partial [Streptosporangiaceae bacterium]|nr:4'-phosphopantetheinyl transferase superfamily protein [Streptosporangiaceae bacterium]
LPITCRNRFLSDTTMCGDGEVLDADGRVRVRITGWTTHRFFTDELVWRMKFTPELAGIGEPQPGGWCLARRRWDGAASRDLLMRQYLNATERAEYDRLTPRARNPWLLGRIAAKDAVRHRLWGHGHGPLFPAELTVRNDAAGRPEVIGPFEAPLTVSIAHTPELGVALVRPAPLAAGIDIEADQERGGAAADIALTEGERALLDRVGFIRLWTAKEAAAKAAGTGLRGRPKDFVVTAADGDRMTVATEAGITRVRSRLLDGHIVTWTWGQ